MTSPFDKTYSSLPGRIIARFFLVLLGFTIGIALFTPWNKIWASALVSLDERLPTIGLRWEGIDRDGPIGFRVRGLEITVADTPGSLKFNWAYVTMGFSPMAYVRLDTGGSECELELFGNGTMAFEGDVDITALLGGADIKGQMRVAGSFFLPPGAKLPKKGWLDMRSQQLILPGERFVEDIAFMTEIKERELSVRDFSMGSPLKIKTSGTGIIGEGNLFLTTFELTGEKTVGKEIVPYSVEGSLGDAIW
ncbi:conserved protein of unknown function [Pseudodesulfovibrio profundus]|uniref:Type II secretion system protein N n=2 Tax=Pseudodesulfovibrio profundus TaxID=57320 RepID=A0A2C8F8S0_9BACT|nr:conserved protein of unknown function [Pseudodesulfovibrio profundus]